MKKNNLYTQIKQKLLFTLKDYKAHDRIPSRVKLANEYNVTRTTIERAISELVGEGYLYTKDSSGTYVADPHDHNQNNKSHEVVWGVILPNILQDTYPGILRGIQDVASNKRIQTIVCNTDNNPKIQKQYLTDMINSKVNGIIIVPSIIEDSDLHIFQEVENSGISLVACNRAITGFRTPKVSSNNFFGGYIATKHLIEQGYKNIAFISNIYYSTSIERYEGYLAALNEANIKVNKEHIYFEELFTANKNIENTSEISHKAAVEMLNLPNKPDAFFCFDDLIAQSVYYAINENGYEIGKDIGLVGYNNNYYICESLPEKLSSVDFKAYDVGKVAANILYKSNLNKDITKNVPTIVHPELVVRETSKIFVS